MKKPFLDLVCIMVSVILLGLPDFVWYCSQSSHEAGNYSNTHMCGTTMFGMVTPENGPIVKLFSMEKISEK